MISNNHNKARHQCIHSHVIISFWMRRRTKFLFENPQDKMRLFPIFDVKMNEMLAFLFLCWKMRLGIIMKFFGWYFRIPRIYSGRNYTFVLFGVHLEMWYRRWNNSTKKSSAVTVLLFIRTGDDVCLWNLNFCTNRFFQEQHTTT